MAHVILRRFRKGNDLIALILGCEVNPGRITSYQHIGQHSEADYPHIIAATRPVREIDAECKALISELTDMGYCPELRQRVQSL